MGVFDTPGDETALAAAPAPADVSEPTTVPTEEELAKAESDAKAAEEAAAEAKKKADAERIAKMNAAKAAKKAAEESASQAQTAPVTAKESEAKVSAPAPVANVKLTPAELADLHEETGIKPSKDDIKTEKDMREYLMSKPKVSVVIPLQPGERPGSTEVVSVNGVQLTIKKGVMVSIPKPFADQVMNYTNIQMENGTVGGGFAIEAGSTKAKALAS